MKGNNRFLLKLLLLTFLFAIPILSLYAADPGTYVLNKIADILLPELVRDFAEGTLESKNQTELLKFQLRFWAAQLGDERLREIIETAISLPGQIAGLDVYDIVDIIFDKWEDIYQGVNTPKVSDEMNPSLSEMRRATNQVNLFKPSIPGPGVSNLDSLDGLKTKLAIQRKALDDHFEYIHLKYFDKAVNDNGEVVEVKPVNNSIPAYIKEQKVNLDKLDDNFNEALSSANISALLESINKQLVANHKTNLLILEALTDMNKSLYYLSIGEAYTNLENEFERQASRY